MRGKGDALVEVELEVTEVELALLEPPGVPTVTVDVTVCVEGVGAGGLGGEADGLKRDLTTDATPPTTRTRPTASETLRKFRREALACSSAFPGDA